MLAVPGWALIHRAPKAMPVVRPENSTARVRAEVRKCASPERQAITR